MDSIDTLKEKYSKSFEISEKNEWLRIKSLKPVYEKHPAVNGPAFLDYNIEKIDERPGAKLEDRSRNVWLRDKTGRGFQSVSYCGGMGIWQVSEEGRPTAASDLEKSELKMVEEFLGYMDDYIFKNIPELKKVLNGE